MNKKIFFSFLIITSLCVVLMAAIMAGLFFYFRISASSNSLVLTDTSPDTSFKGSGNLPPQPLDTPLPSAADGSSTSNLPAEMKNQMDTIQQQVISLRGLQPNTPVTRDVLSPSDLQNRVETEFFKDYSAQDASDDVLLLSTLGLLPKDFDLVNLYKRIYSEQIAGYYDSETKEMYVVKGNSFSGIERMTYAHEYTHTLQDQNYDLQNGLKLNDKNCKVETEYCAAATALVEGDASFIEQKWMMTSSTKTDKQDFQNFYGSYTSPVFDSAPQYLQKDFLFPYKQGLEFVYSLNDRGGYTLVNSAFKNPPTTTEQILHPDKYPAEKAVEVDLPDFTGILSREWRLVKENTLGEWSTFLSLAYGQNGKTGLDEIKARTGAAGWGGDRYAIFTRSTDNAVVFILKSTWDTEEDAVEFFSASNLYGQARWGKPSFQDAHAIRWNNNSSNRVAFFRQGVNTLWLISPDETVEKTVLTSLPAFQIQ